MTGRLTRGVMWDVKSAAYLRKNPDSPFARFLSGWASLSLGDADAAALRFEEAVASGGGYAPAYIGQICLEVRAERLYKASRLLREHNAALKLNTRIGLFRYCCAVSACAAQFAEGGAPGGLFAGVRRFASRALLLGLREKRGAGRRDALTRCLDLLRYIALARREARPVSYTAGGSEEGAASAGSMSAELSDLAEEVVMLPGLTDAFRLGVIANMRDGGAIDNYIFDEPVIFSKTLLNALFREKIVTGELLKPGAVLANLRRDAASGNVNDVNKWLYLKLSHTARRIGPAQAETARELLQNGWWGDPIVRAYTGNAGAADSRLPARFAQGRGPAPARYINQEDIR